MVLPLLLAGAARVAAGSAVRAGATRAGIAGADSMGGRLASQAVGHYGVNAIQRGHQNRQAVKRPDSGISQRIRENPGEALIGGVMMATQSSTYGDVAMDQTNSLLQSTQFSQTP